MNHRMKISDAKKRATDSAVSVILFAGLCGGILAVLTAVIKLIICFRAWSGC